MNDALVERVAKLVCNAPWATASKNTKNNAAITARAVITESTKELRRVIDILIEIAEGGRVPPALWEDLREARRAVER